MVIVGKKSSKKFEQNYFDLFIASFFYDKFSIKLSSALFKNLRGHNKN